MNYNILTKALILTFVLLTISIVSKITCNEEIINNSKEKSYNNTNIINENDESEPNKLDEGNEEDNNNEDNIDNDDGLNLEELRNEIGIGKNEVKNITKTEFRSLIMKTMLRASGNVTDEDQAEVINYHEKLADKILKNAPEILSSDDIPTYLDSSNLMKVFEELDNETEGNTDDLINKEYNEAKNEINQEGLVDEHEHEDKDIHDDIDSKEEDNDSNISDKEINDELTKGNEDYKEDL